jgi:membrane-associated protease RseP (regulator of RpoE activity)
VHGVLLALTLLSTTVSGAFHYAGFLSDFAPDAVPIAFSTVFWRGGWYSLTILAILGCHELGHYLACRHYRVDASLPYFLPAPPLLLTGTLGAFIRIREPIPTKPMLFDIGVAGPIAGFVVAVPALFLGLSLSRMVPLPADFDGLSLGEPLLFRIAAYLLWGATPEGYSLNLHPMAFAAWFGLLATALNLFPIGQLDGGHISYAVLGRRSTFVTLATVGAAILLTIFYSWSWLVWTILMIVMLVGFGPRHPRTLDEDIPLDRTRRLVAAAAVLMFVLCFTAAPIEPYQLIQNP